MKNELWGYEMKITPLNKSGGETWFVVEVPEIEGCIAKGKTRKCAVTNAIKAIEEHIANKNKKE